MFSQFSSKKIKFFIRNARQFFYYPIIFFKEARKNLGKISFWKIIQFILLKIIWFFYRLPGLMRSFLNPRNIRRFSRNHFTWEKIFKSIKKIFVIRKLGISLGFFVLAMLVFQYFFPIFPILPTMPFSPWEKRVVNADIQEAPANDNAMFVNVNPEFKVEFGDRSDTTLNKVRFEADPSKENPFGKEKSRDLTENTLEKVKKKIFPVEKGIEFSLVSAGTEGELDVQKQEEIKNAPQNNDKPLINNENEELTEESSLESVAKKQNVERAILEKMKQELRNSVESLEQVENKSEKLAEMLTQAKEVYAKTELSQEDGKEIVKNPEVAPGVDVKYEIIEGKGIKEDIAINRQDSFYEDCFQNSDLSGAVNLENVKCSLPKNSYTFNLKLDPGVEVHQAIGGVNKAPGGTYYFTDNKGNYLFHFLPPFAQDARSQRTNAVKMEVVKIKQAEKPTIRQVSEEISNNQLSEKLGNCKLNNGKFNEECKSEVKNLFGETAEAQKIETSPTREFQNLIDQKSEYQIKVIVDPNWLLDPVRSFPINIDPSIIHDTKVEFDAGDSLNRAESITGPKVQIIPAGGNDTNTALLLHANGANNSTTFYDNSVKNRTITANADAKISTAQSEFGGSSAYFDGTGDYLSVPESNDFDFEADNFTLDWWEYRTDSADAKSSFQRQNAAYSSFVAGNASSGTLYFDATSNGSSWDIASAKSLGAISLNAWVHLAVVRNGSTFYTFKNGIQQDTWTSSAALLNVSAPLEIGRYNTSNYFTGYIDELRITRGIARWVSDFTPPTNEYEYPKNYGVYTSSVMDLSTGVTSIDTLQWTENGVQTGDGETLYSSTSLAAQWNLNEASGTTANNDAEGSSCGGTPANCDLTLNNFASTGSRDAAVRSGWTADNKQWGNGAIMISSVATADYLSVANPASNALDPNSADLTIETWIETNDTSAEILSNNNANGIACTNNGYYLGIDVNGYPTFKLDTNGATAGCDADITGTIKINDSKYHHLVVSVIRGTSAIIYLDGVPIGTDSSITSYSSITVTGTVYIGGSAGGLDGIVDSTRIYSRALGADEILSNYQVGNIEFQTRTGTDNTPDDGGWEAWKPSGVGTETQMESMDFDGYTADASTRGLYHLENVATNDAGASCGATCDLTNNGSVAFDSVNFKRWGTYSAGPFGTGKSLSNAELFDQSISAGVAEGWFFPISISSPATQYLWFSEDGGAGGDTYLSINSSGALSLVVAGGTALTSANNIIYPNRWYHIAARWTGEATNGQRIYVNGVLVASNVSVTSHTDTTADFYLGNNSATGAVNYFNGYVDEFRLYTADRTDDQVAEDAYFTEDLANPYSGGFVNKGISNFGMEPTIPKSQKFEIGAPQVDSNTVALWRLDETNSGATAIHDLSANANTSSAMTGTTVIDGFYNKARIFDDSDDYIEFSDAGSLDLSANGTIEAWIKTTNTEANNWFLCKNGNYCLGADASGAFLFTGASAQNDGGTAITSGIWHHVAITNNNTTATYYVDGVQTGTDAVGWGTTLTNTLRLGRDGGTNYFDGAIDEVKISNAILTADQIYEDYRAGRDHRASKTLASSVDLSSKTKLPFYAAGDKLGMCVEVSVGESGFANYEPDVDTVALWHLEEESGTGAYLKDSARGNHGTPSSSSLVSAPGKIGKGRSFDGVDDYVTVPDSTDFTFGTGDFTVDLWANPSVVNGNYETLIGTYNTNGFWLTTSYGTDGHIGWWNVTNGWIDTGVSMDLNTWQHIAVTRNSGTISIYKNGVKINSTANWTGNIDGGALAIGWTSGYAYFTGKLDEIRITKGTARSADDIRQAYENGKRLHPVVVDFTASLDAGNLIANSADTSFTIDATTKMLINKGDNIFKGDKIMVKENYDGVEYMAQGTVTGATESTGAIAVASWDANSTFPAGGFTANATVFKWQREWFDATRPLDSQINAVKKISLRNYDGLSGKNLWLDDFKAGGPYYTDFLSTNITSSVNRYVQYRAIFSTTNPAVTPYLSSVTTNYSSGPTNDLIMRHGKWFNRGVKQPFWWAN